VNPVNNSRKVRHIHLTQGSPFTILPHTDPAMSALPEAPGLLNDPKEKAPRWKKE